MSTKKKVIIFAIIGIIVLGGLSYAFFNYTAISEENNSIILGEVAMQFDTDETFYMENVMPGDGIDTSNYLGFTIGGINTDTANDVWYEIFLEYGDAPTGKTIRIRDNDLVFRLTEQQGNGSEVIVLDGVSFQTISDRRIWVNTIPRNTTTDIEYTYKLYVWLNDKIEIGNTDTADYSLTDWQNIYASVKVKVIGDLVKRDKIITVDASDSYIQNDLSYFNTRLQTGVPDGAQDTVSLVITDPESKVTFTYTNESGTTYTNVDRVSIDYTYTQDVLKQQTILLTSKRDVTENVNLYFQVKKGVTVLQEFTKRITVVGNSYCVNNGFTRLTDCLFVSENLSSGVDEAKTFINAKGSPNTNYIAPHYVNGVESQYSQQGLYKVEDDYGDSYVFRGAVTNNNVKFGDYFWKIIRINGDGTIRMIFNGNATGSSRPGATTTIKNSSFNQSFSGPAYVGFMYNDSSTITESSEVTFIDFLENTSYYWGSSYTPTTDSNGVTRFSLSGTLVQATPLEMYAGEKQDGTPLDLSETPYTIRGTASSASIARLLKVYSLEENGTRGQVHYITMSLVDGASKSIVEKNVKSSTIKTELDNWYKNTFSKKLNNEKSVTTYLADEIFCNDRSITNGTSGYLMIKDTSYAPYSRLLDVSEPIVTLKCANKNDSFTVNDRVFGNGKLDYPIGLLTADEHFVAGGVHNIANNQYYLYTGSSFWTMSPDLYNASYCLAMEFNVHSSGRLDATYVHGVIGLRPVINLKSNVTITEGDGTANHPYVIE